MRITTNALLRGYRSSLSKALENRTTAMNHVLSQRSYNSVAEDPAAALRGAQLERKYLRNKDHISMVKEMQSRLDVQEDALMQVRTAATQISKEYNVEALNGTNGEDSRKSFASAIREFQNSIVLSMNATYENTFVFAGTDGKNAPFELTTDASGKSILTYRGIDVNSTDPEDQKKLKEMANESQFVDLGFGLETSVVNGVTQVASSSAYDMALSGLKAIGYGQTSDGTSKNLITLAGQLADELEKPDGQFDMDRYGELMTQFEELSDNVLDNVTQLGVKTEFLKTTKTRLESADVSFQEQIQDVEGIDMAEAITTYSWAQYAYNAALKVGTNILSPSLLDFMS